MIEVRIDELIHKGHLIKKIIFSSTSGSSFRVAYQDKSGIPLLERLDETFRDEVNTTAILVGVEYKMVAFRKTIRNIEKQHLVLEDYKLVGDKFILINKSISEPLYPEDPYSQHKRSVYDGKGKLHYMMIGSTEYDAEGNERNEDAPLENFETIDDVEMQYLDEAVQKLL